MRRKARIVVVEDHPATADALKTYLETQGYAVSLVDGVKSALNAVENSAFDLLICDISLPDGSGWDLMKKLSTKSPLRGIAYTASGSEEDIARSEKAGFIKHLVKGCSTEDITRVIDEALNTRPKPMPTRPSDSKRIIKP